MRVKVDEDLPTAISQLYAPGTHAGVLVLRPDEDGIRPMVELIQKTLDSYALDVLAGTVTVVTPRGIRVRRSASVQ